MHEDLEPLPRLESRALPGREAQEPGSQDLVFRAQLRQLLVEKVNLGSLWPPAGYAGSPVVVSLPNPAGNEE